MSITAISYFKLDSINGTQDLSFSLFHSGWKQKSNKPNYVPSMKHDNKHNTETCMIQFVESYNFGPTARAFSNIISSKGWISLAAIIPFLPMVNGKQ